MEYATVQFRAIHTWTTSLIYSDITSDIFVEGLCIAHLASNSLEEVDMIVISFVEEPWNQNNLNHTIRQS